jgi:hypothetical protein
MNFVKVTGTSFVRDINSMGLSNTDTVAKDEYYSKLRMMKSQKEQLNMVKEEIDNVKIEMSEIKQLLQLLISKQ